MIHLKGVITISVIVFTSKGHDVCLTTTSTCYNVNDDLTLEAEYKGSTPADGVIWTITGGSSGMIAANSTCSFRFAIPTGFPEGRRMSLDCSSAPKYRLTVQSLESADFNKTWGVDFSLLNGTTQSGTQQQTVIQCEIGTYNGTDTGTPASVHTTLNFGMVITLISTGVIIIVLGVTVLIRRRKLIIQSVRAGKKHSSKEKSWETEVMVHIRQKSQKTEQDYKAQHYDLE